MNKGCINMLKKRKKNGFTLVELLAVIVILAVVILIAVTAVIPRMNSARKKALLDEALIYAKMAKEQYAISNEVQGTKCYNVSYLNNVSVKKDDDNYFGAIIISKNSDTGNIDTTINLSNGKYYIHSDDINSINVVDEKPENFIISCANYNPVVLEDANPDTLAYKLLMNEGGSTIEENLDIINERSETVNFNNIENNPSNSGIYSAEDDDGGSFYYRGVINNNWVDFAGFYWRVVRINGDGSIRMIYTGLRNSTHTGTDSAVKSLKYNLDTLYAQTPDISGLTNNQITTKYYTGSFGHTYSGLMYNLSSTLMSKPDYDVDVTNNLSKFPTFKNITATKQYYLFKNFDINKDCTTESGNNTSGVCTLKCRTVGDDCILVSWADYSSDSNNYSTSQPGVYPSDNPTQYVYTSDYKYTCFNDGPPTTNSNSDGTTSAYASCQLLFEIVGTVKNQTAQAKVRYHGLYSPSYNESRLSKVDSNMKTELENWYENNIYNKKDGASSSSRFYEEYIADEIFCNERSVINNEVNYPFVGDNHYRYAANMRLSASVIPVVSPSFECIDINQDGFTINSSLSSTMVNEKSFGNKLLKYPIGLLTADEIVYAGGAGSIVNNEYYLNTGVTAWTMTPMYFHINHGRAYIGGLGNTGKFTAINVTNTYYLRPVINLKASVLYDSGSGTEADPYKVKLAAS